MKRMTRAILFIFVAVAMAFAASEVWKTLPPPAAMPKATKSGLVSLNGIKMYYAVYGSGEPIILLHGGLGNADYWGNQVAELSKHYQVIVADSRGHGRSTRDSKRYTYELMASDVVALMDFLKVPKASLVGWSDGGIIGLVMAIKNPNRLVRVFAFGANSDPSGVNPKVGDNATFNKYIENAGKDYARTSPTPKDFDGFVKAISEMWNTEPKITDQLKTIKVPVTIADGQHDEAILRAHTEMMAKAIPAAKLVILPGVSHFAMWQNPAQFDLAIANFMAGK